MVAVAANNDHVAPGPIPDLREVDAERHVVISAVRDGVSTHAGRGPRDLQCNEPNSPLQFTIKFIIYY